MTALNKGGVLHHNFNEGLQFNNLKDPSPSQEFLDPPHRSVTNRRHEVTWFDDALQTGYETLPVNPLSPVDLNILFYTLC